MSTASVGREDPNVKIPSAIKAAAAQAQEAFEQSYKKADAPADAPKEPAADLQPAAPKEPAPADKVTLPGNDADWQHKFNSMKGRWEQSQNQVRTMAGEMDILRAEMAELRAARTATAAEPAEKLTTEKDVADYGQELLDVMTRRAKEAVGSELGELKATIATLKSQLQSTAKRTELSARDAMHAALEDAIPNWLEINQSPEFLDYLALQDPFSGVTRHTLLKQAYGQNKTPQVLAFFKGFLSEEAAKAPAPKGGTEPENTGAKPGKIPLETLAAPGRAKTAAGSPPAEKPFITGADIAKFYADVTAGKYRGRDDEKARRENEIHLAVREGRLR